jgi:hypothetical protein
MQRSWLVLSALLAAGCLDELPEALTCPPDAQVEEEDCTAIEPPLTGCLPPQSHACMAGPRTTCACDPNECPETSAACFPAGDCPGAVQSVAGEAATCGRLAEEDVGDLGILSPAFLCTCGCTRCMSVCDGKGPTWGAVLDGDGAQTIDDFIFPLVRIDGMVPDAGRLGLYLRMRSLTTTTLQIFGGDPEGDPEELAYLRGALVPATAGEGFVEHVLYDELIDENAETKPLTWTSASDAPTLLTLLPPSSRPGVTLFEIDCAIPFWVE